ncbi:DUF2125 domain-containing protein [Acidisoma sp. 7E03]
MKMRRSLKRFLVLLLLVLLVMGGVWTGVWYVVSGQLITQAAAWEAARQAEGWTIRHAAPRRTGWPMAASVTFDDLSVSGGRAYLPGGFTWTAASLTVGRDIRHLDALSFTVTGRQSLARAGGAPLVFQARRMRAQAALRPDGGIGLIQAAAEGVLAAASGPHGPQAAELGQLAAAARFDGTAGPGTAALTLAAELHDLRLPPSHLAALGDASLLAFDVSLSGPVPARAAQSSAEANAAAWRRAGGGMVLNRFRLVQGPLRLDARGRFGLDDSGRLQAETQVQAEGVEPALTRLAARHVMTAAEAHAMAGMLALMTQAQGGDGFGLPVSLHDGNVNLGPIPLLRLRP